MVLGEDIREKMICVPAAQMAGKTCHRPWDRRYVLTPMFNKESSDFHFVFLVERKGLSHFLSGVILTSKQAHEMDSDILYI